MNLVITVQDRSRVNLHVVTIFFDRPLHVACERSQELPSEVANKDKVLPFKPKWSMTLLIIRGGIPHQMG